MWYKRCLLPLLLLAFCFTVQAHAAPAGFKDQKVQGFTISLPADWQVLSKEELANLLPKGGTAKMLLAATTSIKMPKITAIEQKQNNLTQAEFEALSEDGLAKLCTQFTDNLKQRMPPDTQNVTCSRQKAEKGSALVMSMVVSNGAMTSTTWTFFRGPMTLAVSGLFVASDAVQEKQVDTALKSIKLD